MADIDLLIDGIRDLEKQSEKILHLTANENRMSNTAKTFISSNLSERYYFKGSMDSLVDFNPFMVRGLVSIEKIAEEAERALAHMLQVKSVNLYPLSGIHAMICAIAVGTNPGDIVMSVDERAGGHFATKTILERMGRKSMFMPLSIEGGIFFDYQKIAASAKKHKVKAVYIDLMSHIRPFNVAKLRDLLGDQVKIIYDASHILGLTLGGQFQNPLSEGADILCGNTHKTLPGPHRGLLAFKDETAGIKANELMAGKFYSTIQLNSFIAVSITLLEMMRYGEEYAKQVILNATSLDRYLSSLGIETRNHEGEKRNHQVHIFIDQKDRRKVYKKLLENGISTNLAKLGDNRDFIRIGTQEVTRRGMKDSEMKIIADLINTSLSDKNIGEEVLLFNQKFNKIGYSFDDK